MRKHLAALCLVFLAPLVGCSSINETMKSWEGHQVAELLMSWGPPQQVFDDGEGGRIFVYTLDRTYTTPGSSSTVVAVNQVGWNTYLAQGYTTYTPEHTSGWVAYRLFRMNLEGTIIAWSWKGL